MNRIFSLHRIVGLLALFSTSWASAKTLELKTELDRPLLLRNEKQEVVLKIDITGCAAPKVERQKPLNIALVIDRSGSMGGIKIEQARQAASLVVDQLGENDRFSLVTYANEAEILIPPQAVMNRKALQKTISEIRPRGGTALFTGVEKGAEQLQKHFAETFVNRVILLSDGKANVGPSSPAQLAKLGDALADKGIPVSTIGLGAQYEEDVLSSLAESSDANYYYAKDAESLPTILNEELEELIRVVASEIHLKIKCAEGVTPIELIGRPETFVSGESSVKFKHISGEQNRHVLLRAALDPKTEVNTAPIASVELNYRDEMNEKRLNTTESKEAVATYTSNKAEAKMQRNRVVEVDASLAQNSVALDQAIALADDGKHEAAYKILEKQCAALRTIQVTAPLETQKLLSTEIKRLEDNISAYSKNGNTIHAPLRKQIQWNSYNLRRARRSLIPLQ